MSGIEQVGLGQHDLGQREQQQDQQQEQQQPQQQQPQQEEDEEEEDDSKLNGNKSRERRKIEIKFIENKTRRHVTFSKRKHGIMKKAFELSVLTGTQVLLLVVSETGLVYTFSTPKFEPIVTQQEGRNLIQACLNAPDEEDEEEEEEGEEEEEEEEGEEEDDDDEDEQGEENQQQDRPHTNSDVKLEDNHIDNASDNITNSSTTTTPPPPPQPPAMHGSVAVPLTNSTHPGTEVLASLHNNAMDKQDNGNKNNSKPELSSPHTKKHRVNSDNNTNIDHDNNAVYPGHPSYYNTEQNAVYQRYFQESQQNQY